MNRSAGVDLRGTKHPLPTDVGPAPRRIRRVLITLGSGEECASLGRILATADWSVRFAPNLADCQAELGSSLFGVVICVGRFGDGCCWRDVLSEVQRLPIPPQLIVADRGADEALWAEVFNLGCYDLLTMPFEPEVTLRVLSMAWEFWNRERERSADRWPPRLLAQHSSNLQEERHHPSSVRDAVCPS